MNIDLMTVFKEIAFHLGKSEFAPVNGIIGSGFALIMGCGMIVLFLRAVGVVFSKEENV